MEQEGINRKLAQIFSDTQFVNEIKKNQILDFEPGDVIVDYDKFIRIIPLILEGSVKVYRVDESGNEIFLYYLEEGQTCALTMSCCNAINKSQIKAIAEEKTKILAIPIDNHNQWLDGFRTWKDFVAKTYQARFQELLRTIDEIAFHNMDSRLLNLIKTKSKQLNSNEIFITHKELANDLGTSREVISRLLKALEKKKYIELGRNMILLREDLDEYIHKHSSK
jgi:CRP/FNR family transcriptional regulator, anaerobic regulatory protein